MDSYGGSDLLYLNPKGTISPAAVIKKGEKRIGGFRERKLFDATTFPTDGSAKLDVQEEDEEEEASMDKRQLVDMEG